MNRSAINKSAIKPANHVLLTTWRVLPHSIGKLSGQTPPRGICFFCVSATISAIRGYQMTNRLIAMTVFVASLVAGTAQAAPVTWLFGGAVDTVDSMLTGTFHVGDPVSIRLTFDPSTPAVMGSGPNVAAYDYIQFGVTFGTYSATYVPDVSHITGISVLNNSNSGLGMADGFGATGFDQSAGPPVSGLLLQTAFVSVFDFTQTIFSDTSLPSSLNLADFQTTVAGMQFCTNLGCGVDANPNQVQATIRSFAIVGTVPEPATWILTLLGLCALASFRARSQLGFA